jgi:hypothetical protein
LNEFSIGISLEGMMLTVRVNRRENARAEAVRFREFSAHFAAAVAEIWQVLVLNLTDLDGWMRWMGEIVGIGRLLARVGSLIVEWFVENVIGV